MYNGHSDIYATGLIGCYAALGEERGRKRERAERETGGRERGERERGERERGGRERGEREGREREGGERGERERGERGGRGERERGDITHVHKIIIEFFSILYVVHSVPGSRDKGPDSTQSE